ncbi:MAG: hypothetical protein JNJ47_04970 [Alphaproteobacteria bacterium]|nr:hypothetical protein [Alphaproteobacteria bacterium]
MLNGPLVFPVGGNNNNFTGTLTIEGDGTVQGTTDTLPSNGTIENNGTLTFSQTIPGTYPGQITGTGAVNLSGNGVTYTLTENNNSYSGGTFIQGGATLLVQNGVAQGPLFVLSGSRFSKQRLPLLEDR